MDRDRITPGLYPVVLYQLIKENSSDDFPISIDDLIKKYEDELPHSNSETIRRSFYRNLQVLQEYDHNIQVLMDSTPTSDDWYDNKKHIASVYYCQPYSLTDLQLMSDAIIFSGHLNKASRKELLDKIQKLYPHNHSNYNSWFANSYKLADEYSTLPVKDLYANLDNINLAIEEKQCIRFDVCFYNERKSLHPYLTVTGFSPYKICLQDGVYYVLGSPKTNKKHEAEYEKRNLLQHIKRYPLHKITNIRVDNENSYFALAKTQLKEKSMKEIVESIFNPHDFMASIQSFSHTVELFANDYGLQIILDNFYSKAEIKHRPSNDCSHPLTVTRLPGNERSNEVYYIKLKGLNRLEWKKLINLLLSVSTNDLVLFPCQELQKIIEHLQEYLDVRDIGNQPFSHK